VTNGWRSTTIGESCTITSGGTPSRNNKTFWDGDVPWVSAKDLKSDRIHEAALHISRRSIEESATKIAPVGSLLMLVRGMGLANGVPIGEVTAPVAFNQDIRAIHPDGAIVPRFLLLALRSKLMHGGADRVLSSAAHGTLKIDTAALREIDFQIPSLAEQRRIIGILDEAFGGIATAKARAASNVQNAHAIFASHLQSVFAHRGDSWKNETLAGACRVFADGDWVESKDQSPEGIRLIQTGNVGRGLFKDRAEKARYVSEATFKRLRCTEVFEGDCLISRLPDPVGRSCILPTTGDRMITAVDCTIVRFDPNLLPQFFVYYSQSSEYLGAVNRATTGTTRSRISRSNLGQLAIPVPPLADQQRIIGMLDLLSVETQRLATIYERKLADLDALKTSLLHQALTGNM
jgi:restriction endonuclease S subunit